MRRHRPTGKPDQRLGLPQDVERLRPHEVGPRAGRRPVDVLDARHVLEPEDVRRRPVALQRREVDRLAHHEGQRVVQVAFDLRLVLHLLAGDGNVGGDLADHGFLLRQRERRLRRRRPLGHPGRGVRVGCLLHVAHQFLGGGTPRQDVDKLNRMAARGHVARIAYRLRRPARVGLEQRRQDRVVPHREGALERDARHLTRERRRAERGEIAVCLEVRANQIREPRPRRGSDELHRLRAGRADAAAAIAGPDVLRHAIQLGPLRERVFQARELRMDANQRLALLGQALPVAKRGDLGEIEILAGLCASLRRAILSHSIRSFQLTGRRSRPRRLVVCTASPTRRTARANLSAAFTPARARDPVVMARIASCAARRAQATAHTSSRPDRTRSAASRPYAAARRRPVSIGHRRSARPDVGGAGSSELATKVVIGHLQGVKGPRARAALFSRATCHATNNPRSNTSPNPAPRTSVTIVQTGAKVTALPPAPPSHRVAIRHSAPAALP